MPSSMPTARLLMCAAVLCAMPALAQVIEPKAANPGDGTSSLLRESALAAEVSIDAGVEVMGSAEPASPAVKSEPGFNVTAALKASVRASYQGATPFPLDLDQTPLTLAPLMTRVRVAPELHLGNFGLIAEADTASGAISGIPPDGLVGTRVTYPSLTALELRKLYLEYKWATGVFRVGQQTSQWGLGLVANDGGKDPQAGDFGQQQFGALTYRGLVAVRPFFSFGGNWRAVETAFAADLIVRDNNADFIKGDRAFQGVIALRYVKDELNNVGIYAVYRNQRNINDTDGGKAVNVVVVDLAGQWEFMKHHNRVLTLGFEAVTINGTTTQARNQNADILGTHQFGAAAKLSYRVHRTTFLFDWGFASGDQNPSDDQVQNFRFDRDFKVGLILFDHVMAYHSARSATRASDPALTGRPSEGVDLLGTAGSVTGAWYLFPRVKHAVTERFDLYGGPLFAFSTAALTDPFNTAITGGSSVNPFGVKAGQYLGTEFDLGAQARFHPVDELLLSITGEGGLFVAGNAYRLPQGGVMPPIGFGRIRLSLSL